MSLDLSSLAAPDVVEALDYETIRAALIADYQILYPEFAAEVESEPAIKLLETAAYRELGIRQRINDAARALLLTDATGADLDLIAFTYYNGLTRLQISAGDPDAIPPVPATYESDKRLRERCRLSLYGRSCAGPKNAYKYFAMTASADVKHVHVSKHTPAPGDVTLIILSEVGDGVPTQELLDTVQAALDEEEVRPLNDTPIVLPATVDLWSLDASLICYPDANTSLALQLANAAAEQFAADHHALGHDITISALHAALHVAGVQKVVIDTPAADLVTDDTAARFNIAINIAITGTAS